MTRNEWRTERGLPLLPEVFTVEEAGEVLGISRTSAYLAVQRGDIPSVRIGRRILVPRNQIMTMLGQGVSASSSESTTLELASN